MPLLPTLFRKPLLTTFHKAVELNAFLRGLKYRYVFVLAHMRSGSTLLSHILTSHPDFIGAGETHTVYRTAADLPSLITRTCEYLHKIQLDATYVVDQINHTNLVALDVPSNDLIKCVILIRAPEATLKSIMSTIGTSENEALDYYTERLNGLALYGKQLGDRALLVEYDALINYTERTLASLTAFFKVAPGFSADYRQHKATGRVGDPSPNISVGKIIRTEEREIQLGENTVSQALAAFHKCRSELLSAGVLAA